MHSGESILIGTLTARATAIAFATTFLAASVSGAGTWTALLRAAIAALAARVVFPLLARPVVSTLVAAAPRDTAAVDGSPEARR